MFGMGMGELVVILIVALLVLGPDKIPEAAKSIGKIMREIRRQTKSVQEQLENDNELASTVRDLKNMVTGEDDEPKKVIKPSPAAIARAAIAASEATTGIAAPTTAAGIIAAGEPIAPPPVAPMPATVVAAEPAAAIDPAAAAESAARPSTAS